MENEAFISCDVQDFFLDDTFGVLRAVVGCMYCGIVMSKVDGDGFVLWNDRAKEILGKGAEEIPAESWAEFYGVHEETGELCRTENLPLVKAISGKTDRDHILFIKNDRKPDGAWINCNAQPIFKGEKVVGGVVVFQDISEKQIISVQLSSLKQRLAEIMIGLQQMPGLVQG